MCEGEHTARWARHGCESPTHGPGTLRARDTPPRKDANARPHDSRFSRPTRRNLRQSPQRLLLPLLRAHRHRDLQDQPALRRVANTAVALGSLDLVGIGQAVLDRTVEYTKLRHQFGRPIASFQAAQHLIANMHIALSAARLAAHSAVFRIASGHAATRETAIARMHAATAARLITLDAHQLHGGIGYVTETDLHLWSERARLGSTLGGGADVAASWLEETMETRERR